MLISWVDFLLLLFWVIFIGFFTFSSSLLNLLLLGELLWIMIYSYASVISVYYDSIFAFLIAIYILGLATGETTIGLSLIILKLSIFGSINTTDSVNKKNYFLFRKKYINNINSRLI
uniref:NADH dehydrogenase subunit 4L n=1 Tax=Gruberia lanceolata TaxID=1978530 RepID=A0A6C0UA30_9CILI|nr:NADH dehydrogenase subunit 4L [Gruberia lanceolata]